MELIFHFSHGIQSFIVFSTSLLAYLDPGSGSFILQLILASLVGSLFVFKNFWKRVVTFVRGIFSKEDPKQEE